jgi:glycosyltransferase involved in cell wall biosynthesis
LKVLLVTHGYPPELSAGTERVVERLAVALAQQGHAVAVATGTFEPKPAVEVARRRQDGVEIYQIHRDDLYFDRWEKTYHPVVSAKLREVLREFAPDVVHAHQFIRLSRDLAHIATQARVPLIYTFHDFVTTCLIGFRAPGEGATFCELQPSFADCVPCAGTVSPNVAVASLGEFELLRSDLLNELKLASACCAVSQAQREKLARFHGLPSEHFRVVPLAPVVDLPAGTPAPEPPPLRVATWGVQMERKGVHVLIDAVKRCGGLVELDIFGRFDRPAYEARCRADAAGLPVRFHGRFEWDELIHCPLHLAVFPSLTFETFGLTIDESWALGHPVVATDLGAYRERAGGATYLFKPGDSAGLASILMGLIESPGRLAQWRRRVEKPGGFGRYVADMTALYGEAIARGPAALELDAFDEGAHPDAAEFARRERALRDQLR